MQIALAAVFPFQSGLYKPGPSSVLTRATAFYLLDPRYVVHTALANVFNVC
jgi:hypothetical protein